MDLLVCIWSDAGKYKIFCFYICYVMIILSGNQSNDLYKLSYYFRSAWLPWSVAKELGEKLQQISSSLEFSRVRHYDGFYMLIGVGCLILYSSMEDITSFIFIISNVYFSCRGTDAWFSMCLFPSRRRFDCSWNLRSGDLGSYFVCIPSRFIF